MLFSTVADSSRLIINVFQFYCNKHPRVINKKRGPLAWGSSRPGQTDPGGWCDVDKTTENVLWECRRFQQEWREFLGEDVVEDMILWSEGGDGKRDERIIWSSFVLRHPVSITSLRPSLTSSTTSSPTTSLLSSPNLQHSHSSCFVVSFTSHQPHSGMSINRNSFSFASNPLHRQ